MVETRLWAVVCGCFVVGLSLSFSPPSDCFSLPSMMTWAPCPHGVRTRGKKEALRAWCVFVCYKLVVDIRREST